MQTGSQGPRTEVGRDQGDYLDQQVRDLVARHATILETDPQTYLIRFLNELESVLKSAYIYFRELDEEALALSYAAEWFLDNYYLIKRTLRQLRRDLPYGFYQKLPKLQSGIPAGYPRVYDLARWQVGYENADISLPTLQRIVKSYQEHRPLTMGELWALPGMLRFVLLASLVQALSRVTGLEWKPGSAFPATAEFEESSPDSIIANSFTSLRKLAAQDWKLFFEENSIVEQILRNDPANIYSSVDFDTRDHYRKAVEDLAAASALDEVEVAHCAVQLATRHTTVSSAGQEDGSDLRQRKHSFKNDWVGLEAPAQSHVGYFLVGDGCENLEEELYYRPSWLVLLGRWILDHPLPVYFSAIVALAFIFLWPVVLYVMVAGGTSGQIVGSIVFSLIPAITVSVSLVNAAITRLVPPSFLPKLDFENGVPTSCQTMVVIPSIVSGDDDIQTLLQAIELHYLRNPYANLGFALLTDFSDANYESRSEDEELVEKLVAGVRRLNQQYENQGIHPFYLFHRRRKWNPREGVWMGWERKRGKLAEFNRLVSGNQETSFYIQEGDLSQLPEVRYVITLDTDTVLPSGSAARLVATLAHPLNRARFDPKSGELVAGYTILQPRTEIKPTSAHKSIFSRIYSGDTGLDLYTHAVSDVYQDFFGEGVYVGKGIYDVAAFERTLAGRVPENALLSHDLFEGVHGRVGLVTDIALYEDFPSNYIVHLHRMHRWIRGDWQLLPWLLPRVPQTGGTLIRNKLSGLNRWKILDNLRRSLLSPALLALFLAGWLWLPGTPFLWTLVGVLALAAPVLTSLLTWYTRELSKPSQHHTLSHVRYELARWMLGLVFLPVEALVALDAIAITLVRLLITRRNLLEWTTAARTGRLFGQPRQGGILWLQMSIAVVLAAGLGVMVFFVDLVAFLASAPLLIAWLLSPVVALRISRPIVLETETLSPELRKHFRRLARLTWLFFEQFVGPEDHWLPPDNFQEYPRGLIAHRTSPTNIGLLLVATFAAYDFGYVDLLNLISRLQLTLESLDKLERHRGHFLNWYDTRNLESLPPRYVSTVDSGNLAACFLVTIQACRELPAKPVMRWERWRGLLDLLDLFIEITRQLQSEFSVASSQSVTGHLESMRSSILALKDDSAAWGQLLIDLYFRELDELDWGLRFLIDAHGHSFGTEDLRRLRLFTSRLHHHFESANRELALLLPWLKRLSAPPELFVSSSLDEAMKTVWSRLVDALPATLSPEEITEASRLGEEQLETLQTCLAGLDPSSYSARQLEQADEWCRQLREELRSARIQVRALLTGNQVVMDRLESFVQECDFSFLFDQHRQIFHIGYNVDAGKLDPNYYDLLASESRIASMVAIANRDVPIEHWLHLSRPLTQVEGKRALLSWSASMFEYLMPDLFMHTYPDTLLHQSGLAAVERQIDYGLEKGVPWGISEAGYYSFDVNMNYQYRSFGVPGLGFKRGLEDDLVISPYASLLALSLRSQTVMQNIHRMEELGMLGIYGFYESIDFTPSHLPLGQDYAIVRSYMAHHQGMIMMSLVNFLKDKNMVRRLHADRRIQSVELLLQELIPRSAPLEQVEEEEVQTVRPVEAQIAAEPWEAPVQAAVPQLHILSNGRFTTFLTSAGSGYCSWKGVALTRWRPDTTLDSFGIWIYVKDLDSQQIWSAGYQPTAEPPEIYSAHFFPHKAEMQRRDDGISLAMEVTVPPDVDGEVRIFDLTNHSESPRTLRITSFGEVVLNELTVDRRHPAFNKLFIESEFIPDLNALIFARRLRSNREEPIFMIHALLEEDSKAGFSPELDYETNRAGVLGRGKSVRFPAALCKSEDGLTGTTGATLDPVMSLSRQFTLEPHQSVGFALITLAASSREEALALASRLQEWDLVVQMPDKARSRAEAEMREIGLSVQELKNIQQLQAVLFYPQKALRAAAEILSENHRGQPGLWGYEISGDYPILLIEIGDDNHLDLLAELLRAHIYWRRRGLKIDLVILNQQEIGYAENLSGQVYRLIERMHSGDWLKRRGGIFILREKQMAAEDVVLLKTAAGAVLAGDKGSLEQQLTGHLTTPTSLPSFVPSLSRDDVPENTPGLTRPEDLIFDNGFGGFSPDGREYVIYLTDDRWTPAPWVNVIANASFGFLVSESGSSFTWRLNSGENRLTAWKNDPVSDPPGETVYLRDEETGYVWSPTPLPVRESAPYLVRHGAGYSSFQHNSQGLKQSLLLFTVPDEPVKIVRLTLENTWDRVRRITATYFVEWVLGSDRDTSQLFIIPEFDSEARAILARNPYNREFGDRVAFLASDRDIHGLTTDRSEFLGRMGDYAKPAALNRIGLSGSIQPGSDPCAAIQVHLDLKPGEKAQVHFLIGQVADPSEVHRVVRRFSKPEAVEAALNSAIGFWEDLLGTVQVETPDVATNLMLNRWLLYQALSCRIWGRSAFYQSSGAYGYRDQLQDVMSLLYAAPDIAREHILSAAAHQFEEGDVLHWWHPPSGRGVRTRITDDLVWLPFVTAHYVSVTGDESILDEEVAFRRAPLLGPNEEERYGLFPLTEHAYPVYEHCLRALERGATTGPHSLPLMGAGDWNDGMNRVGIEGYGESVWLGWFLRATLLNFAELCEKRGDLERASLFKRQAAEYEQALQDHAWDGSWYLRAYYDDGSPLGSSVNQECQIDSIAQSWAVFSGSNDQERIQIAMDSVFDRLLREDDNLLLLFAPPFNKTPRDPGYIKGYPPGVRENGGQYTHAAIWTVWAYTLMGQGDRAGMLFRMLNPVYHSDSEQKALTYKVEPYVIAADIYGAPPHTGRGGWTWYTGSSGWYYRLGIEAILGLRLTQGFLKVDPCIPANWPYFKLSYRHGRTTYNIIVNNPSKINRGIGRVELNGNILPDRLVPLIDDGAIHTVQVVMGSGG